MQIEGAREAQRSLRWAPIFKRDVHLARKRTTPKHRRELPLPSYLMRGAIEGGATGGAQWHSVAIRWHSVALRGNPWQSGNPWQPVALSSHQWPAAPHRV